MACFIPSSRTEIVPDTLVFIPHTILIPTINTDNFLTQAAFDIITLLTCTPSNIPSTLQKGYSTKNGLLQLATLLNTDQIANDVINKQEHQQNVVAATTNIKKTNYTTTYSYKCKYLYTIFPTRHQMVTISISQIN